MRRILPAYGVRFIALNDNIDTLKDSCDDLVVSVKSIINDAYCRDISVKTRSALNIKRKNGDFVGACTIYGYIKSSENHNQLVVDEYPASIVKDIYRMKMNGMSALKIAKSLNDLGVLSPMEYKKSKGIPLPTDGYAYKEETKWSPTTIIRILQDETYTGKLIQGKQGTLNYKIKDLIDRPETEWVVVENTHEAIISKADFELVKRIMRLDTRTAPGGEKVYTFSGVLICGSCGARMTRKTIPYKDQKYHYYYCPTTKKRGCDKPTMLKENDLYDCILQSIKAHISNVASLEDIIATSDGQRLINELVKQCLSQIKENESKIEQISSFKSTLYENMVAGIITKEEFKALKNKYNLEETNLKNAVATLNEQMENAIEGKGERLKWMEQFKQFQGLNEIDRRTVINLIQSIHVESKKELTITFSYQAEYESAIELLSREVE